MAEILQEQFIIPPEYSIRTFDSDDNLPPLPVPSLEKTIQRYLKSVKPFAESEDEYAKTKNIANKFLDGVGANLHEKLLQHACKHKNWVDRLANTTHGRACWVGGWAWREFPPNGQPLIISTHGRSSLRQPGWSTCWPNMLDRVRGPLVIFDFTVNAVEKWWIDYGYLSLREPLLPNYNMVGCHPSLPDFIYEPGQQIKVAAAYCHQMLRLWQLLREGRLQTATTSNKQPLCMDQFRRIFNCSVDPGIVKDSLRVYFKTVKEGSCSSQVVVLCNGHIFMVDGIRPDGKPLTMDEWEIQLTEVKKQAQVSRGSDIPCLAADVRNLWAQNKKYLADLSPGNASILASIDSAMFAMCLDDMNPDSEEAVAQQVTLGNYSCRWPDIATSIVIFNNGRAGGICLHSPFDGIVTTTMVLFIYSGMKEILNNDTAYSAFPASALPEPQQIGFSLDQTIKNEIKRVKTNLEIEKKKFALCANEFYLFGKQRIQKFRMHPDSFIQMVLQLAYYKLHSKFAPCYETATTRTYYHGRTETVRSCSEDCALWVKSMVNPQQKDSERAKLLWKAVQTHEQMMKLATNGEGYDRHLFGLYCLAMETGLPLPDLFTDPLFSRSGGNGNFVLSTSLLGYSPTRGAVAPMCLHGYGIFYNILPDSLLFTMTARTDSKETDLGKMFQSISTSLQETASLLDLELSAKL